MCYMRYFSTHTQQQQQQQQNEYIDYLSDPNVFGDCIKSVENTIAGKFTEQPDNLYGHIKTKYFFYSSSVAKKNFMALKLKSAQRKRP